MRVSSRDNDNDDDDVVDGRGLFASCPVDEQHLAYNWVSSVGRQILGVIPYLKVVGCSGDHASGEKKCYGERLKVPLRCLVPAWEGRLRAFSKRKTLTKRKTPK